MTSDIAQLGAAFRTRKTHLRHLLEKSKFNKRQSAAWGYPRSFRRSVIQISRASPSTPSPMIRQMMRQLPISPVVAESHDEEGEDAGRLIEYLDDE